MDSNPEGQLLNIGSITEEAGVKFCLEKGQVRYLLCFTSVDEHVL